MNVLIFILFSSVPPSGTVGGVESDGGGGVPRFDPVAGRHALTLHHRPHLSHYHVVPHARHTPGVVPTHAYTGRPGPLFQTVTFVPHPEFHRTWELTLWTTLLFLYEHIAAIRMCTPSRLSGIQYTVVDVYQVYVYTKLSLCRLCCTSVVSSLLCVRCVCVCTVVYVYTSSSAPQAHNVTCIHPHLRPTGTSGVRGTGVLLITSIILLSAGKRNSNTEHWISVNVV